MSNCPPIPSNPDIDGIGVRAALYVQTYLAILTYFVTPFDSLDAWMATIVTSVALQITAIVSIQTLTLYHALLVTWLSFPATFFTLCFEIVVGFSGPDRYLLFICGRICNMMYVAFALWVWTTAPHFGQNPECNDTVWFALLKGIHVNNGIRYWFIMIIASWGLFYVATTLVFSMSIVTHFTHSRHAHAVWAATRSFFKDLSQLKTGDEKMYASLSLVRLYTLVSLIFLTMSIIMVELMIRWNNVAPGSGQWTYGQIIATLLLAAPLFSLQRALRQTLSRASTEPLLRRPLAYTIGSLAYYVLPERYMGPFEHLVEWEEIESGTSSGHPSRIELLELQNACSPAGRPGFHERDSMKLLNTLPPRKRAFSV